MRPYYTYKYLASTKQAPGSAIHWNDNCPYIIKLSVWRTVRVRTTLHEYRQRIGHGGDSALTDTKLEIRSGQVRSQ